MLAITFLANRSCIVTGADREMIMRKMMADARKFMDLDAIGYALRSQDPATLSDWCLRDIGLTRFTRNFDAAKPFWMA